MPNNFCQWHIERVAVTENADCVKNVRVRLKREKPMVVVAFFSNAIETYEIHYVQTNLIIFYRKCVWIGDIRCIRLGRQCTCILMMTMFHVIPANFFMKYLIAIRNGPRNSAEKIRMGTGVIMAWNLATLTASGLRRITTNFFPPSLIQVTYFWSDTPFIIFKANAHRFSDHHIC